MLLGHKETNLNAGAGPGVADDITLGYTVGSRWIDTTNDREYVCLDNTIGAAVWADTTLLSADVDARIAALAVEHSDIAPGEGFVRKTGAGTYTAHKTNLAAGAPPAVGNDDTQGYSVGSRWIDIANDKEYVCLDDSTGAAVWVETTQSGGGVNAADVWIQMPSA